MSKVKRILAAQLKRLTGDDRPRYTALVYIGTVADLYREAIRDAGEEPHA